MIRQLQVDTIIIMIIMKELEARAEAKTSERCFWDAEVTNVQVGDCLVRLGKE